MAQDDAAVAERPAGKGRDGALVRGLRQGTHEAAEELCERFGPKLFAYAAARFPGDPETAEDVMVQSLTDAARNIRRYDAGRLSLTAWLYGVTRGQIADELRRRRRRKAVPA